MFVAGVRAITLSVVRSQPLEMSPVTNEGQGVGPCTLPRPDTVKTNASYSNNVATAPLPLTDSLCTVFSNLHLQSLPD